MIYYFSFNKGDGTRSLKSRIDAGGASMHATLEVCKTLALACYPSASGFCITI